MNRIRVVLKRDEYIEDKKKIQAAFARNGYDITTRQAGMMWAAHSASMAAGWLALPDRDVYIVESCRPWFDEVDE